MYYTYLLKCIPTNEFYYGVKYSKDADPNTFWRTYFTSSEPVLTRIDIFGKESFVYEIRKTFNCPKKARIWEDKVLRKLRVIARPDFLNKSYGLCFDKRKTRKGHKMMYFLSEDTYRFVDKPLVKHLIENNIAIIKGQPKPKTFGKSISEALTGKKKSKTHITNIKESLTGKKYGSNKERYGIEKAEQLTNQKSKSAKKHYDNNTHHAKGKTYEEIYGDEKTKQVKEQRSKHLTNNNPGKKMKGKRYEELYDMDTVNRLKLNRSNIGKNNTKTYNVYHNNNLIYTGDRHSTPQFISTKFSIPISNLLYRTDLLTSLKLRIESYQQHN